VRKNAPLLIRANLIGSLVAAIVLAGCGGGGYSPGVISMPGGGGGGGSQTLQTAMLSGSLGFVNSAGRTVYVFDADLGHTGSVCTGTCAANWPPVGTPGALTTGFSSFTRIDNTTQLAYNGRPLYTFVLDTQAGQTSGDGVNAFGGLWHIARPAASSSSPGPMPSGGPY
jgi:predicted lipoprotein with Yx(FWY)xxD motif